jgi:hypothetical protein
MIEPKCFPSLIYWTMVEVRMDFLSWLDFAGRSARVT